MELTPYQERVFEAIGTGKTYQQIADELGLKPRTVKSYADLLRQKYAANGVRVPNGRALIPLSHEYFAGR